MHMLALRRKERLVDPLQRLRSISRKLATAAAVLMVAVSYTHLTLPTILRV